MATWAKSHSGAESTLAQLRRHEEGFAADADDGVLRTQPGPHARRMLARPAVADDHVGHFRGDLAGPTVQSARGAVNHPLVDARTERDGRAGIRALHEHEGRGIAQG